MIKHESVLNALCKEPSEEIQTLIINYVKEQEKKEERAKKVEKLLNCYQEYVNNLRDLVNKKVTTNDIKEIMYYLAYIIDKLEEEINGNKSN